VPIPIREENGFAFSAEETLALITPRTRLMILNSPANPTGGVTPKAEIDRWSPAWPKWPDVAILSDEIYGQMTYDGLPHVSLLTYPEIRDRVILLDGWSKTYAMTGWRLGWSVWPDALYENGPQARRQRLVLRQRAGAVRRHRRADRPAGFGRRDGRRVRRAPEDRRRGTERLPGFSCITPKGAFYAFPNISKATGFKAKALATALLEEATSGVATIGGPDFGILGEGYAARQLRQLGREHPESILLIL
jgi:aspartate aminotransferase